MEGLFTAWTGSQYTKGLHKRLYCFLEKKKPRRGWPSRDWRERRNAIRLTTEHTVETLVVADADMVQYHGAEAAQRFILTVMNMVYNMFQHQSLGIKVNIQVTKLVLLRQRPAKLSIGHHGERSLESFCHWQNEEYGGARYLGNNQVPGGKDDTPPVDAAVFVTREFFKSEMRRGAFRTHLFNLKLHWSVFRELQMRQISAYTKMNLVTPLMAIFSLCLHIVFLLCVPVS
ncbi:hypothetical protein J1605_016982 [Eschrichtius robustus]|uniref:A disintegrin and metalloproteinase with thrombospondin motifs 17 n=1 Tax=Eschrichtius robustus TaxID=9764 RepID=A0AB34I4D1_ESCRO|nr:hypothetical protein J1605_016982 [Eschrichtius robustus]